MRGAASLIFGSVRGSGGAVAIDKRASGVPVVGVFAAGARAIPVGGVIADGVRVAAVIGWVLPGGVRGTPPGGVRVLDVSGGVGEPGLPATGTPAGGVAAVRGTPVGERAGPLAVPIGDEGGVGEATLGAIGALAAPPVAVAVTTGALAAVPVAVRATAIGFASAAASAASRAVCSILNTTRLSFVRRFTARRTPGRPNRLTGVDHASTTVHRPRSTGVLSSSWIENAVSSPTGRSASVDTKKVVSSQNR